MEPREQVALVQLGRLAPLARLYRLLERPDIAPALLGTQSDLLFPPADNHLRTELLAEEVHGLSQRRASVLVIGVGPQEAQEGVAPVKAAWRGRGEVGEKGNALGLGQ